MHKADWDLLQRELDSQTNVTNLEDKTVEEIENLVTWTNVVKNATDTATSNHQYSYQLKTKPEIKALQIQYKTPTDFSTHFG